ncbi:unnamed protein product [Blumeria hordei]|uniref:Uncharacterized protein n=1 Tax=Blumeria hordei TaxID=2867405 RepID=A0A383UY80_BLUHO|nr:unnamed protein product [Blumeria hordei]
MSFATNPAKGLPPPHFLATLCRLSASLLARFGLYQQTIDFNKDGSFAAHDVARCGTRELEPSNEGLSRDYRAAGPDISNGIDGYDKVFSRSMTVMLEVLKTNISIGCLRRGFRQGHFGEDADTTTFLPIPKFSSASWHLIDPYLICLRSASG